MRQILLLANKVADGEVTESEANEFVEDLLLSARRSMTEDEFMEIQRGALAWHHLLTEQLPEDGYQVPGNNPRRPN